MRDGLQGAQAHRVPRNQRSSFAMISIVLLSGGALKQPKILLWSQLVITERLVRASQHARDSNGVRERTRASALIYFTWRKREGERMLPFFILAFLHRHRCLYDAAVASLCLYMYSRRVRDAALLVV